MKRLFCILLLLFPLFTNAQAVRKKNVLIDLGGGLGVYHAYDNLWGQLSTKKANAGAYLLHAGISYAIIDQFTMGAELQVQSFLTESGDTTRIAEAGNGGSWLIRSDYYFLKKEKFTWFAGLGIGGAGLNYERSEIDTLGNITTGKVYGEGPRITPRMGIKLFFGKKRYFGFFLDYGFNAYVYNIKMFTINDVEQDRMSYRPTEEVILNARGHEIRFGLSLRFGK
ncbi:MAG: hypothetical protein ACOZCO_00365 [Bacteroidota bacterium]